MDQSPLTRSLLETALAAEGLGAISAGDPLIALRMISEQRPDLVILDTVMRVPTGEPLLKAMRSDRVAGQVPVIVLTDLADRASVVAAIGLRVSAYMLKSQFQLELLVDKVHQTFRAGGVSGQPGGAQPTGGLQPGTQEPQAATGAAAEQNEGLRSLRPLVARSDLEERLRACEQLRAFSPALNRVLKLTRTPGVSMDAVVQAVSQDHAIALKLLKVANSAALNTGEPVDTVKKAVLRMGLEKVQQAVVNIAVVERFSSAVFTERFNFAHFWEHSIACGLIAAELARAHTKMDPDNAFTMGLLHDVGRVALVEQAPDLYAQVLEAAERLSVPLEQAESRLLLLNHADIMDRLLRAWNFPRELVDPITLHHLSATNIRGLAAGRAAEVAVLALANRLAHALLLGSSGNDVIYPTGDLSELLRVDASTLARIESTVGEETGKIKLSMLTLGSEENWPMMRDRHRTSLQQPLRPLFMSPDPKRDALRIFCHALADPPGEAPNIGVIHIPEAKRRAEISNLYRSAEAEAGVEKLPLIVLSPTGKLRLEDALVQGRQVEYLATPLPVPRFVDAVNRLLDEAPAES